ncbi:MAG: reverse transcriptase family protein, partial [Gammaproteobacteria bacterium]|nr:reverse transcriptase family protein [Gammaproteobacteria bacterium]
MDLVLATSDSLVNNVQVGDVFSTSDHRIVTFSVNFAGTTINSSYEKVPDYKRADFRRLKRIITSNDWELIMQSTNAQDAWTLFKEYVNRAVSTCVPFRNRRPTKSSKPKWWNSEIKRCLLAKKQAHQKYRATNNEENRIVYCNLRRDVKRLIKQSKKNLETHVAALSKCNPKEFFNYIRNKKVLKTSIGPLATLDGSLTNDDNQIADILNSYFVSVFTTENSNFLPSSTMRVNNEKALSDIVISESDVLNAINKLKINKTPGPDRISPRVLKQIKCEISRPLAQIFNTSLRTGTVPKDWKIANVTPIFKKGNKSHPGNYRPISLTSVVCKLLETIIRDKIVKHLEENELIRDSQHGFRNNRSCLTNLLDFFHDIINMFDETKAVDIVYLDFQKAFDKVPHKRLIDKLGAYGIRGNVCKWIENWLTERKQRVVINGKESGWMNVTSGVPQGSVLGPVLFLIYIDDIDEGLSCKISKFADDTKIGNRVDTPNYRLRIQRDLEKVYERSQKWQMSFNIDKCKVLNVGSNNINSRYNMNSTVLDNVTKEKDLGVTISDDLKPSHQCTQA